VSDDPDPGHPAIDPATGLPRWSKADHIERLKQQGIIAAQQLEIERLTERNGKLAAQVGEQVGEIERVKTVLTAEITAHLQTIERLNAERDEWKEIAGKASVATSAWIGKHERLREALQRTLECLHYHMGCSPECEKNHPEAVTVKVE
jgi:FtsZ-binding cell division protein ZapB